MLIRQLDPRTYDVFNGTGFEQWTRIRRFHWGFKPVQGVFLNRQVLKEVVDKIIEFPDGSVNNV